MRRAFTLVELLTVIAILAVLYALAFPMAKAALGAATAYRARMALGQLAAATSLYMQDADDTYPIAMSVEGAYLRTWFGVREGAGDFDFSGGYLSPYTKGKAPKDPVYTGLPYLGDGSGFGYNWGTIGSDMHLSGDYRTFPNCVNPARGTELSDPYSTVLFATSAIRSVPWLGGDGRTYDFGFVDPPYFWNGNPNMDFRHGGVTVVDTEVRQVRSEGYAALLFCGGQTKMMKMSEVQDRMFLRQQPSTD